MPIWVDVTVHNVDIRNIVWDSGRSHFNLDLYVHDSADFKTGSPVLVSQEGVYYNRAPIEALFSGYGVKLNKVKFHLDSSKFTSGTFTHLIIKASSDVLFDLDDEIDENNYAVLPIIQETLASKDVKLINLGIRQNKLIADGSTVPESKLTPPNYDPSAGDKLSFTGNIDFTGVSEASVIVKMYYSTDKTFDRNKDVDSGIQFELIAAKNLIKATEGQSPLNAPSEKVFCGTIYGIMFAEATGSIDRNFDNNWEANMITVKCDATDTISLTELEILPTITGKQPKLWPINSGVPVALRIRISCNLDDCSGFTNSQKNFQLKVYMDQGDKIIGNAAELLTINENSVPSSISGDGLNSSLTNRYVDLYVVVNIQVTNVTCAPQMHIGVQLLKADGSADAYTDNDYLIASFPTVDCDGTQIDLSPTLSGISEITPGAMHNFKLQVQLTGDLPVSDIPKFRIKIVLSKDTVYDQYGDFILNYDLNECQYETLKKSFSSGSTIDISDPVGFKFEETFSHYFCDNGNKLYVGVFVDSNNEHDETLEDNNIAWSSLLSIVPGPSCSNFPVTKTLEVKVVNVHGPPYIRQNSAASYEFEIILTNAHNKIIERSDALRYTLSIYLSQNDSKVATGTKVFKIAEGSADEYTGGRLAINAGQSLRLNYTGELCDSAASPSCTVDNVLDVCTDIQDKLNPTFVAEGTPKPSLTGYTAGQVSTFPALIGCQFVCK